MFKDRLATAMIPARDFARARAWYADTLGLTPAEEFPDGGGAVYMLGGGLRAFLYPTAFAGSAQHTLMTFTCHACAESCEVCIAECEKLDDPEMERVVDSLRKCRESCLEMVEAMGGHHQHDR